MDWNDHSGIESASEQSPVRSVKDAGLLKPLRGPTAKHCIRRSQTASLSNSATSSAPRTGRGLVAIGPVPSCRRASSAIRSGAMPRSRTPRHNASSLVLVASITAAPPTASRWSASTSRASAAPAITASRGGRYIAAGVCESPTNSRQSRLSSATLRQAGYAGVRLISCR